MKAKNRVLIMSFVILAAILASIFAARSYFISERYRTSLEYSYARSMGDLTDGLEKMKTALEKSEYCSTATMQHQVSTAIISYGGSAKANISHLPFSDDNSAKIEKLVSVAEDYAFYTSRKLSSGQGFSEDDFKNFKTIGEYIGKLNGTLTEIRQELGESNLKIGKAESLLGNTLNVPDAPAFDDGLKNLNEELDSFPTLLYDGPFSDHIEQQTPAFLEGKEEITKEEAILKAAEFLETDRGNLKCDIETQGPLAAFEVRGENLSANVTKAGGEISWAKKSADIDDTKLSYEEALEEAREFLSDAGISDVKESYYIINDNTCTINFNAVQDGITIYPDLIKITVELNEGGIVEYQAQGYLMNHKTRENTAPKITEEQAAEKVSKNLTVESANIAIVPTEGKNEVLTYEFHCSSSDGNKLLVYINAETGFEEDVFILDQSDNGIIVK